MASPTILLLLFIVSQGASIVQFPIAGLFNADTLNSSRDVFKLVGVSHEDRMSNFLGRIIDPSVVDVYSTALEVCKDTAAAGGVAALIDARPTNGYCDDVCLICNKLNIPHLSLGWEPTDTLASDEYTFSYAPPPKGVSKAFATLINMLDWNRFTIFYEDDSSFMRLRNVIGTWSVDKEPITFRKINPNGDNRQIFKDIMKTERLNHHILDCEVHNLLKYFKEITQVENSTYYQSFILTNLDTRTLKLKELPKENFFSANVSILYMMDSESPKWNDINYKPEGGSKMETALAVDALAHLVMSIKQMMQKYPDSNSNDFKPIPPLCLEENLEDMEPLAWGADLRDALLSTQINGFTGHIEFDDLGQRINFQLHHAKLIFDPNIKEYTFINVGMYNSQTEEFTNEHNEDTSNTQQSTVIRVVSKIGRPYFDIDEETKEFRGYAVDLVQEIIKQINLDQKNMNLTAVFKEVDDKLSPMGAPIEGTKRWSGIIGELMDHKVDLGICDLSITADRNAVVDFSTPFMTTGISMLFAKQEPEPPDQFSFINPLSLDVWLYLAVAYIIVSYILLICARMSQDDWVNPHPCNQNPENLQNIWSLYNCMWLTMGSIMTQGCDILPRGLGSRWVAGVWYFFAMIVTASYTANMSTFLSSGRRSNDIADAKALSEQNKIMYGAVKNSSTYNFFKKSNDSVHMKLWQTMDSAKPTVFTANNDEGKERVLKSKGNYVFFMESTAIKYYTERNCNLKMVGPLLDSKSYGIAMPKNFMYKWMVDTAILKLQERGVLTRLAERWWNEEWNENKCEKREDDDDGGSLQMQNTAGIFMVLGMGGVLGLIVAIIDFMLHAQKIAVKEKVTFKEALASEWRASLNPRTLSKPTAPPRSAPASTRSNSPARERSNSRAVSVLRAASVFINFDDVH